MKRFHYLLKQEVIEKKSSYRELGKKIGLPPMSISDYILFDTEPRMKAVDKVAAYFQEPPQAMLLEQSDHSNYDVEIYKHLDKMSISEKELLLKSIKMIRGKA